MDNNDLDKLLKMLGMASLMSDVVQHLGKMHSKFVNEYDEFGITDRAIDLKKHHNRLILSEAAQLYLKSFNTLALGKNSFMFSSRFLRTPQRITCGDDGTNPSSINDTSHGHDYYKGAKSVKDIYDAIQKSPEWHPTEEQSAVMDQIVAQYALTVLDDMDHTDMDNTMVLRTAFDDDHFNQSGKKASK